jgi:ribonuclease BN (tRNA processing enzyme)
MDSTTSAQRSSRKHDHVTSDDGLDRDLSRRNVLTALGGITLAAAATGCRSGPRGKNEGTTTVSAEAINSTRRFSQARTRVVLLGTAGGPLIVSDRRKGISTAVVYDDRVYVVDLGIGSYHRLAEANLGIPDVPASGLANLRGILFTHMHSDHVADWPAVYATTPSNITGRTDQEKIRVIGPGPRDTLARVYPPDRQEPQVIDEDHPTPGVIEVTRQIRNAWAADLNDRRRDSNYIDPDTVFDIHEIDLSGTWRVGPEGVPPLLDEPLQVWVDGDVHITATLVDHRPTAPAFGYRFDTPDGSVVVSGDTTVSENLVSLARNADVLVHEVMDAAWVDEIVQASPAPLREALREHLLASHTTIEQVGGNVAGPAGVGKLVLTHLGPADHPDSAWSGAQDGFSGDVVVGSDLMVIPVP